MPPDLFVNFNKQFRWQKTDKDELGLDWGKVPFSEKQAIGAIFKIVKQTEEGIMSSNSIEDKEKLHYNALSFIQMILNECQNRHLVVVDDLDGSMALELLWKTSRKEIAALNVIVQNREPFYSV